MNNDLENLFNQHTGKLVDKWLPYLGVYDHKLNNLRTQKLSLIEIGVQNGGSLEIWEKYFTNAQWIIGVDIDERISNLEFTSPKICTIISDASKESVLTKVVDFGSQFEIIIDDGSHVSSEIIKTFKIFWPLVAPGGQYFVEDLHCAYWKESNSGFRAKNSAVEFFKQLVDILNAESIGISLTKLRIFEPGSVGDRLFKEFSELHQVDSIEFVNSLICITKKDSLTTPFTRIVRGELGLIVPNQKTLHKSNLIKYNQLYNPYSRITGRFLKSHLSHVNYIAVNLLDICKNIGERAAQKMKIGR